VTYENVQNAIAAFERTLVTNNSPFDKYAAGDVNALTPAQRRGLATFRSAGTRCFECHSAPTFSDDSFSVTGVPDLQGQAHDTGRLEVESTSLDGAFKAPTLRNIALTAPYMHNGAFDTLEEVVDFYAKGGGRDEGVENVDIHVIGFDLTDQEKADLVAFMYALTDESNLPEIPTSVPSGLAVVESVENPAREIVSEMNAVGGEQKQLRLRMKRRL
jgi:cytochrome c peroxidase